MPQDVVVALGRVLLAGVLGALIGLERELRGKPAGLRTNLLVAGAAAVLADVSINGFTVVSGHDPSRVAADVVSGVGFLGAGVIFASGGRPRGLTTAAALWASAAVGLTVGVGRWQVALGLVVLGLGALAVLRPLERVLLPGVRQVARHLYVVVADAADAEQVQRHLGEQQVEIRRIAFQPLADRIGLDLVVRGSASDVHEALASLGELEAVLYASDEHGSVEPRPEA